jgi:hypothetical protein
MNTLPYSTVGKRECQDFEWAHIRGMVLKFKTLVLTFEKSFIAVPKCPSLSSIRPLLRYACIFWGSSRMTWGAGGDSRCKVGW